MSVYNNLSLLPDQRKGSEECIFNGLLSDYLNTEDAQYKDLFTSILPLNDQFHICVGLGFNVNKNVISNQIIRYKDVTKLPEKAIRCPFILYLKEDETEKGIILCEGDSYLLSKGFYYCLTEQDALLEQSRNELIAMSMDNPVLIKEKIEKFLREGSRAGGIQREIDNYYFTDIQDLVQQAEQIGMELKDKAYQDLPEMEERDSYIYHLVSGWYLLKKVVYVSCMMNKNILNKECEGDVKKQRYLAKTNADKIPFIAYSELWRMKKEA